MYGKIFASLFDGSMRGKPDLILVFVYMLSKCDKEGSFDCIPQKIADDCGISRKRVDAAIAELEAPDEDSRSPQEDGRRIVPTDEHRKWGWRIVNHAHYRKIANAHTRKEIERERKAEYRSKKWGVPDMSRTGSGHAVSVSDSEVGSGMDGDCQGEGSRDLASDQCGEEETLWRLLKWRYKGHPPVTRKQFGDRLGTHVAVNGSCEKAQKWIEDHALSADIKPWELFGDGDNGRGAVSKDRMMEIIRKARGKKA